MPTTKSPVMLKIRNVLDTCTPDMGPMTSEEIADKSILNEGTVLCYMKRLERDKLAHVAAWRKHRWHDVAEWLPGPSPHKTQRPGKDVRSAKDKPKAAVIQIRTEDTQQLYMPRDQVLLALLGKTNERIAA